MLAVGSLASTHCNDKVQDMGEASINGLFMEFNQSQEGYRMKMRISRKEEEETGEETEVRDHSEPIKMFAVTYSIPAALDISHTGFVRC